MMTELSFWAKLWKGKHEQADTSMHTHKPVNMHNSVFFCQIFFPAQFHYCENRLKDSHYRNF